MSVELFMVWHQVVILLYLLDLFDKSVFSHLLRFSLVSHEEFMETLYLPFSLFFQYFLSCAKEHVGYFIIIDVYFQKF